MKTLIALLITLSITGCGTVNTVFRHDSVTSQTLGKRKTYCDSVQRVYSGVTYDACVLNAPDITPYGSQIKWEPSVSVVLVDMVVSGVFDTVLLPYSVYQQIQKGSIPINRVQ